MFSPSRMCPPISASGSEPLEGGDGEWAPPPRAGPPVLPEPDPAPPCHDALLLEQHPLGEHTAHVGPPAYAALRIHHPVPRHVRRRALPPLHSAHESGSMLDVASPRARTRGL